MPFAGKEILPRYVYGAILKECILQGVTNPHEAAINLLATSMFEAGYFSKIRDNARTVLRANGTPEVNLPPRYWVLYEKATYDNGVNGIDRGIFMFNSIQQPGTSDDVAFNFELACRDAVKLYKRAGLAPWFGWKDIMSPDALEDMRVNPDNKYRSHLPGAEMRWQRTYFAQMNYELGLLGFQPVSVAGL